MPRNSGHGHNIVEDSFSEGSCKFTFMLKMSRKVTYVASSLNKETLESTGRSMLCLLCLVGGARALGFSEAAPCPCEG